MFLRFEPKARYDLGRALDLPIEPHGDTLTRFAIHLPRYQMVWERSRKTGERFAQSIDWLAGRCDASVAFTGASAAFWGFLCEQVREAEFPELPSRLASVFACPSVEEADKVIDVFERESLALGRRSQFRARDQVIYEVLCEEPQSLRAYDMAIYDTLSADLTYEGAVEQLSAYWRGDGSPCPTWECLVMGESRRGPLLRSPC